MNFMKIVYFFLVLINIVVLVLKEEERIEAKSIRRLIKRVKILLYKRSKQIISNDLDNAIQRLRYVFIGGIIFLVLLKKIDTFILPLSVFLFILWIIFYALYFVKNPKKEIMFSLKMGILIIVMPTLLFIANKYYAVDVTKQLWNSFKYTCSFINLQSDLYFLLFSTLLLTIGLLIMLSFECILCFSIGVIFKVCSWASIKSSRLLLKMPYTVGIIIFSIISIISILFT